MADPAVWPFAPGGEYSEELAWLDALDARLRWETIEKIVQFRPLALVISGLWMIAARRRSARM